MSDPVAATFAALADPTRRHLLDMLSDRRSATATEIARDLPITRQAVTKHLAALGGAGLVVAQREGRETRYHLTPEPLEEAVAWIARVGADWDERLARLSGYVERHDRRPS